MTHIHSKSRQFPVRNFSVFARTRTHAHHTDTSETMPASPAWLAGSDNTVNNEHATLYTSDMLNGHSRDNKQMKHSLKN